MEMEITTYDCEYEYSKLYVLSSSRGMHAQRYHINEPVELQTM